MQGMRGYRFCEAGLITGTSEDDAIANIWNTTGACDPTPEQFGTLDADTIARENGALSAWLNPVSHWMFDLLDVREAGDDRRFGCIAGTWMDVIGAATLTQATGQGSYSPGYIDRNNTLAVTFNAGSEVYLLDAPDGEIFIMESFTRYGDPTLSEGELAHLYDRLDLPGGWGFRAETSTRTSKSRPTSTTSYTSCMTTCTTSTWARMRAGRSGNYGQRTRGGNGRG
jgi:haloalkane dehalogenase